ncbi:unnamed protein product [Discula destructiva]
MGETIRYELEFLLHLKDSPLCAKPKDLPPQEEYMGPPQETVRPAPKTATDRPFGSMTVPKVEQAGRRPGVDRHGSRNGTSEGLVLGPPRTNFSSTTRTTFGDSERNDKTPLDSEFRDRLMRGKMGAIGGDTETRGGRRANFRGREDAEREGEGWNKVKPRKSFGQDGAERFTGRMGGDHRQQREDRGKERDEQQDGGGKDRRRTFDADGEEGDAPRRNGLTRGKTEPWFKESTPKPVDPAERAMNRERIEKAKSWRTQDPEEKSANARGDRNNERHDRRWERDREPRQEREPEWMDEPVEEKNAAHTEEEFRKFMERARGGPKAAEKPADAVDGPPPGLPSFFAPDPSAAKSAPAIEQRPDKFFAKFSDSVAATLGDESTETINAPVTKSSKFANFFSAHTEPSTPAAGPQPPANGGGPAEAPQSDSDRHFAALMSKLHMPSRPQATPTPPNMNPYSQPQPQQPLSTQSPNVSHDPIRNLPHVFEQKASLSSPEPPLPFGLGRPEEPRLRSVPPPRPEIMAPRPMQPPSQPPTVRHDQLLHELLAQRQVTQSQGSGRAGSAADQHTAHLMQLMQQQVPDQRPIEAFTRLPQHAQRQPSIHHFEPEHSLFMREHGLAQPRQMQPAAGFENQFRRSDGDGRIMQQQQPPPHPHILQRQQMIPPGLDHGVPPQQQIWLAQQQQQQQQPPPPPGQRLGPMIPAPPMQQPGGRGAPPGLSFGPAMGNGPVLSGLPHNMLQPGDNMAGLARNMPPPGFFTGGPPASGGPGFMPPPGMGAPFPGPDAFFSPGPYDGRGGMPPPGSAPFRR